MKRKLFLLVAVILAALFLVACEESSTPTVPVETPDPTEVTPVPSDPTVPEVDEAVLHVIHLIMGLPEIVELVNREQVDAVFAAYQALSEAQKSEVINFYQLQTSVQIINGLKAELDQAQAKFDALPSAVRLADKNLITEARLVYDELSNELKSLIVNFNALLRAESEIRRLEAEIKSVENRISEITSPVDINQLPIILSARQAYDSLTEEQQQRVTNINHLNTAQLTVAEIEYQIVMVSLAIASLNDVIELSDQPYVVDARRMYDELTPIQKAQITNLKQLEKAERDLALVIKKATDVVDLINTIPRPIRLQFEPLIQEARTEYDKLTKDLQDLVTNVNLLTFYESNITQLKDQALAVKAMIDTLPQPMILSAEDDALMMKYAYDALDHYQQMLVTNYYVLNHALQDIPKLINEATKVQDQIAQLSVPAKVNERFLLDQARFDYDRLHSDQKQLVTNASRLTTVTQQMANLLLDIYDMEALIMTINFPITLGMKGQLTTIRHAFNQLTADQQFAVLNRNTLFNAELEMFALESATPIVTVAQARAMSVGDDVAVEVVVTSNSLIGSSFRVFVEDTTAGIALFMSSPTTHVQGQLSVGNKVLITGKIGTFNGQIQIVAPIAVEVIETGVTITPTVINDISDLAQHEGKLISITAVLKTNNRTMVLIDQTGEVAAYFYNNADFTATLTGVPQGTLITLVAPLGYFNALQFSIFSQADITVGSMADSTVLNPIVIQNLVLPQANDQLTANLNLTAQPMFGRTIEWTSSNPAVIANDGTVTRPASSANDESVTMSYEVKDGLTVIATGNVEFTVLKQEAGGPVGTLMIYEIYGGGGNSGATYTHDYIVLYNGTSSSINLTGYSIQYASATGTSWNKLDLTGTIASGGFYLIRLASGGAVGAALPATPDIIGSINMSATAGKVALVQSTTALSGATPTDASIVDLVGFGSNASAFEGVGRAPAGSNQNSIQRNAFIDTDDNAADFSAGVADLSYLAGP